MTDHRASTAGAERHFDVSPLSASNAPPPVAAGVVLSAADYAELMRELDELRRRHRGEVSQRLRDARDFGSPGDDDDRLAIREDAAFAEARIAQLEHLARFATVVAADEDVDGVAGLGSVVRVADEMGATMEFELVGRRTTESKPGEVSLASPVGKALTGVRPGDVARVALPSGEIRVLSVLDVVPSRQRTRSDATAEAA
jgi:transcription elongation factor GreA